METLKRGHETNPEREGPPGMTEPPPFPGIPTAVPTEPTAVPTATTSSTTCCNCCTYGCTHVPTAVRTYLLLKYYTYCCTYVLKKIPEDTTKIPRGMIMFHPGKKKTEGTYLLL